MNVPNLSEVVAAKLARLRAVQESPKSLSKYKNLLALNDELRNLRKLVWDKINALSWGDEKKEVMALYDELDQVLSNWEYGFKVDISDERLNELEKELSAPALNNSKRRELRKERRRILAFRKKLVQQAETIGAAKSKVPAI